MVNRTRYRNELGQIDGWTIPTMVERYRKRWKLWPISMNMFPANWLVSYYKLNETTGTSVADSFGSNTGTASNVSWVSGKINNAGSFTTTTSKILLANETAFDFDRTQAFSVSMWVKLNSLTNNAYLFSKQLDDNPWKWYSLCQMTNWKMLFEFVSSTSNLASVTTPTLPNTTDFSHVTATYDGSSSANWLAVYINWIKQTNTVWENRLTSSILNNQQFEIWNRSWKHNFWWLIDEVGIWNRALTQDEITTLYNNWAGLTYNP